MAIKKSELFSSLWSSCDELRGGMDASQYKDYVLVLLFVKYVSDKYAGTRKGIYMIVASAGVLKDGPKSRLHDCDIHGEMDRISQALTQRVKELAESYESPLSMLTCKVADLSAKVAAHLKMMGFQP